MFSYVWVWRGRIGGRVGEVIEVRLLRVRVLGCGVCWALMWILVG